MLASRGFKARERGSSWYRIRCIMCTASSVSMECERRGLVCERDVEAQTEPFAGKGGGRCLEFGKIPKHFGKIYRAHFFAGVQGS